ncbi:carboxylesterase/lipase family protein [Phenylobacterium sp.]|jgi:para-nitrobenzyl esterase|uniref:carboxylesterase/lipase family protein n=1 Tax=Phenylobacterium sp. TaxID=1871053 RepID=UPI002F9397C5
MFRRALVAAALCVGVLSTSQAVAQAPQAAQPPRYQAQTAAPAGEPQVVKVRQGALKGSVANGVAYHLGIPFAAPPVGDLRWRPPQAAAGWTGERDATKAGAVCQTNEDCLFLNVVRPAGARKGQKLPVMVWIHGGAFVTGTSMGAFGGDTEGSEFARKGIVHVSANHRLGRPGWFAHPALTREGHGANYGQMDQIAALKWVQANIADFGGDPKNVTIYGESAGGIAVLYLMGTPQTKGLFHKAIAHSSFGRGEPTPLKVAEETGVKVAEAAGVKGSDAAAAAALRKLPLSAIAPQGGLSAPGRPFPILDGDTITASIADTFKAGREHKVPLVIGGNSHEASLTRPTAAMLDAMPEAQRAAVTKAFDPQGSGDKARIINDYVTVRSITEPDRFIARLHAKNGAPTWVYYFSYVPAAERARKPYGAGHTDEIRFVFGSPRNSFAPEDLPLSNAMNTHWANLAKKGDPGAPWPRFTLAREAQIEFGADGPQPRERFLKDWRDAVEAEYAAPAR